MDFMYFLTVLGCVAAIYLAQRFMRFWWMIFRCYVLTKFGFVKDIKKYGEWAVVTGATNGIGKEYARQLAKRGLKVVLISRTKEKLDNVAKQIEEEFNVETKTIIFDFSNDSGYENIESELSGLDIGILVNNVGVCDVTSTPFQEKEMHQLITTINCNLISEVRMCHIVMKGMAERKRGMVIHVSSSSVYYRISTTSVYPATKSFMAKFCKDIRQDNVGIEHQLVIPFAVSTGLVPVKETFHTPSAKDYVTSAVRTIGLVDETCGDWVHEIQRFVFDTSEYVGNLMMNAQLTWIFSNMKTE